MRVKAGLAYSMWPAASVIITALSVALTTSSRRRKSASARTRAVTSKTTPSVTRPPRPSSAGRASTLIHVGSASSGTGPPGVIVG